MRDALGTQVVSERRACKVLGQPRTTHRHPRKIPNQERRLVKRIVALATQFGRYGYRRITALLRREGWRVNHKRVARIWRQEGLKVPKRQPKRGRLWFNDGSCVRLRAQRKDHVWSYDLVQARTHDGRPIRILTIVDEFTREYLAIDVARQLRHDDVLERLAWLMSTCGVPERAAGSRPHSARRGDGSGLGGFLGPTPIKRLTSARGRVIIP